jgi:hypothetical protein
MEHPPEHVVRPCLPGSRSSESTDGSWRDETAIQSNAPAIIVNVTIDVEGMRRTRRFSTMSEIPDAFFHRSCSILMCMAPRRNETEATAPIVTKGLSQLARRPRFSIAYACVAHFRGHFFIWYGCNVGGFLRDHIGPWLFNRALGHVGQGIRYFLRRSLPRLFGILRLKGHVGLLLIPSNPTSSILFRQGRTRSFRMPRIIETPWRRSNVSGVKHTGAIDGRFQPH